MWMNVWESGLGKLGGVEASLEENFLEREQ